MLWEKLTYSNVMSTIAVFGVLAGGTAIAADKLGSKDIKRNAIKERHIKAGVVGTIHLADRTVTAPKVGEMLSVVNSTPLPDDGTVKSVTVTCPADSRMTGGGADVSGANPDVGSDTPLLESKPTISGPFDSEAAPIRNANSWHASAVNVAGGIGARQLNAWVVCLL